LLIHIGVGYDCSTDGYAAACSDGYYSLDGATTCTQCPAGSECPDRETVTVCDPGYYSPAGEM